MSDGAPTATAFAPGHVTGFFVPVRHDDPARAGSRGAGLTLTDGVEATVSPSPTGADRQGIDGAGPPAGAGDGLADVDAVDGVLAAFDRPLSVQLSTPLPVGAGFGVSGAAALATAYAADALVRSLDGPAAARTEDELVSLAHVADVEAGSGLGDVVAQARGGAPIRRDPGAPPHGEVDAVPAGGRMEYHTLGELSTAAVLEGDTGAIERAGAAALDDLLDAPTLGTLFGAARTFAVNSGLLTDDVATVLADVDDAVAASTAGVSNATATMAMLGRSVLARDDALTAAGYDPRVCAVDRAGARLVAWPEDA